MRICRFLLSFFVLFIYSCGGAGSDMPSSTGGGSVQTGSSEGSMTLTASRSTVAVQGTSTISATVLDSDGANIADGTTVTFSLSSSSMGTIIASATTTSGVATAIFTASTRPGTVTVTATALGITETVTITISEISITASPSTITVQDTSTVSVTVFDSTGANITDGTIVAFSLSSSSLGTITSTATTTSGVATVTFTASTTTGTVVVTATALDASNTVNITINAATINLSANPSSITVNDISTVSATVRDGDGVLIYDGTLVTFSLSSGTLGTITSLAATTDGIATATFEASTTPGTVVVTASVLGVSNTVTITINVATVTLAASSTSITVNDTVTISATVRDGDGVFIYDGTLVTFSLSSGNLGTITSLAATTDGIATATFEASTIPGTVVVTATALDVSNTVNITINAASITLAASSSTITVNGTSTVSATVRDGDSDFIADGTLVTFSLSSGTLGTITSLAATTDGIATATFEASTTPGTVVVTASVLGVSNTVTITINAAIVTLAASSTSITVNDTVTISATVRDGDGVLIDDGTLVTFSLSSSTLGTITSSSTTTDGIATATFEASTTSGSVLVTGTAFGASDNITIAIDPPSITVVPDPLTITVGGTSVVSATVLDRDSNNIANGTTVTFSLSSSSMGTITSTATTSTGVATATFTASTTPGTVTVTGTVLGVSDTEDITISTIDTGSIEFTSASPSVIGIKGSGQTEMSLITFTVKDINGNEVSDGTDVDFVMSGPNGGRQPVDGGEYIGDDDGSPTTASSTTVSGVASVYLNSGTVAGPVVIIATVTGTGMSSSSSPLSIGGGTPNYDHLTIATDTYNLEGLGWVNIQANISVFLADRFGNFNVLEGTTVSFYAESGAIDRNDTTDADGTASVVFRTQSPDPENVAPYNVACAGAPSSVSDIIRNYAEAQWSDCLWDYLLSDYGITTTAHPRDGWATIMVSTRGEEAFDDEDADGEYDIGEAFTDTSQDAFLDVNDNDTRDTSPFELFIDDDANGYDGVNGDWDSDKTIFKAIKLLITGPPVNFDVSPSTFAVADSSSVNFKVLVADENFNPPIGGTTLSVSSSKGTVTGASYTFPDENRWGPNEVYFNLADADEGDSDAAENALITIKVTYKNTDYNLYISGTVD